MSSEFKNVLKEGENKKQTCGVKHNYNVTKYKQINVILQCLHFDHTAVQFTLTQYLYTATLRLQGCYL